MRKLTELDLQNALDECEVIRFRTHGDWLAGMIKRLNAAIMSNDCPPIIPPLKIVVKSGNIVDTEVPCIS